MKLIRILMVLLVAGLLVTACEETDKSYDRDNSYDDNSALYVGLTVENRSSGIVEVYVGNTSYPIVLYPDNPDNYNQPSEEYWSFQLHDGRREFVRIVVYNYYGTVIEDRTFAITNESREWTFVIDDYRGIEDYQS
ncbi:MAG: hypothetical protein WC027_00495 [Candidatus Paceibacterota bacterium]